MANMVVPNEGKPILLNLMTGKVTNAGLSWKLGLYVNAGYTPANASVLADLTAPTWSGYAPITLTQSTWTSAVIDSNQGDTTWGVAPSAFTVGTGPQTVQGWYIWDDAVGKLLMLQQMSTPIPTIVGTLLQILPEIRDTWIP